MSDEQVQQEIIQIISEDLLPKLHSLFLKKNLQPVSMI